MAPNLLTIPAEIRNSIYELVLTDKKGVNCRLDSRGTRRLCLYEREAGEDDDSLKVEQEEDDQEDITTSATRGKKANGNIPDQQGEGKHSVMIGLHTDRHCTAEGTDHGRVQIHSLYRSLYVDGDDLKNEPIRHTIANQLQFVCRQLRRETRRLSLRYNKIVFSTPFNDEAMLLCERFLKTFPEHFTQALPTLAIKVKALPTGESNGLRTVMSFCHATPTAQVHMHIGQLSRPRRLMELACRFSRMYSRHVPFLDRQKTAAIGGLGFENFKDCVLKAPRNFRLRYGYDNFNETALRKIMEDDHYIRLQVLPALRGDADGFVKFVKEFVEIGI